MCGIGGFYSSPDYRPTAEELVKLLTGLETRGHQATGVAWQTKGVVKILKSAVTASEFVLMEVFLEVLPEVLASRWILCHTRLATHGSPQENKNNHPIYNERGLIIHNGVVFPDDELPGAKGETDTEQILLHVQKHGWDGIAKLRGSLSIALVNFKRMDTWYVYSHNQPFSYQWLGKSFAFASTSSILKGAVSVESTHHLKEDRVFRIKTGKMVEIRKVEPVESCPISWWDDYIAWGSVGRLQYARGQYARGQYARGQYARGQYARQDERQEYLAGFGEVNRAAAGEVAAAGEESAPNTWFAGYGGLC